MQQFQVPQFINIEDRIIGPLTLKQFFYLLGSGGAAIVAFVLLPLSLFIIIGVPIALFFALLAFAKIGGQPLPVIVGNAVTYFTKPRMYLWKSSPRPTIPVLLHENNLPPPSTSAPTNPNEPFPIGKLNDVMSRIHSDGPDAK